MPRPDRLPRRKVLIVTQVGAMLQAAALALLVWSGHVELWQIGVLALLLGLTNAFGNPAGLISWLSSKGGTIRLRPDHKLAIAREMRVAERVRVARDVVANLERIGREAKAA